MPTVPDAIHPTSGVTRPLQALDWDAGQQLVIAIDTLVHGVHFPAATAPGDVGFKALAVNLSDLAAMGAAPRAAQACLTHPRDGEAEGRRWLAAFEEGLGTLAQRFGIPRVPAQTARGPLSVTVEVLGSVPRGMALCRDGAAPGDLILVTGTLGDAGLALSVDSAAMDAASSAWLQMRLARLAADAAGATRTADRGRHRIAWPGIGGYRRFRRTGGGSRPHPRGQRHRRACERG
jgi:thiamine-monophosphate kinase